MSHGISVRREQRRRQLRAWTAVAFWSGFSAVLVALVLLLSERAFEAQVLICAALVLQMATAFIHEKSRHLTT